MEFGWINIFGIIIVVIMLIPNIMYAIKNKGTEDKYKNKLVNILEQFGRYGSLILTIFPIGINGFDNVEYMLVYLVINTVLLLLYLIVWVFYFKNKSLCKALFLAIIPTIIFLICGITLRHLGLMTFSIIFGTTHILMTYKNNC